MNDSDVNTWLFVILVIVIGALAVLLAYKVETIETRLDKLEMRTDTVYIERAVPDSTYLNPNQ